MWSNQLYQWVERITVSRPLRGSLHQFIWALCWLSWVWRKSDHTIVYFVGLSIFAFSSIHYGRYDHFYLFTVWSFADNYLANLWTIFQPWFISALAIGAFLDILIAGLVTYFLKTQQSGLKRWIRFYRNSGFSSVLNQLCIRTNNLVNTIVAYSISSGASLV